MTQFPDNAQELMRQAVQAAALYNQQCAELRRKNRDRCVDRHTKVTTAAIHFEKLAGLIIIFSGIKVDNELVWMLSGSRIHKLQNK